MTLREIKLGQESFVRDEPITVKISLQNDVNLPRDITVRCTIRDTFGRDIYRQEKEMVIAGKELDVLMALRPSGGILRTDAYWLKAEILDTNGRAAMAWRRLYVPIPAATKHETYWGGEREDEPARAPAPSVLDGKDTSISRTVRHLGGSKS